MKRLIKRIRCLLPLLVLPLIPTRGDAEDWPQFRGHNAGGVSTSEKSLPTEFSDAQNRLWSVKVGDGACSPIVFDGRVFTTAMCLPVYPVHRSFRRASTKEIQRN